MTSTQRTISFHSQETIATNRFDDFCTWAEPGGSGGFNGTHDDSYLPENPWFSYSSRLIPHSHSSVRSWFIKQENLSKKGLFGTISREPYVKIPDAFISGHRFLRFAKSFINIYTEIRGLRSPPKASVNALIMVEKALRNLNDENNDPSLICRQTFHQAQVILNQTILCETTRFESGKALEQLSLMLQGGGSTHGNRRQRSLIGLHLIDDSFTFKTSLKSTPRYGKKEIRESGSRRKPAELNLLSSEEIAAVGMAYVQAKQVDGLESFNTFIAALVGLTFTTTSMRASELQILRADALYTADDKTQRVRLRIPRPKIGIEQDVPIPAKLEGLAKEFHQVLLQHSQEAREALTFYIKQSPTSQASLHTLYIPERLKHLFTPKYLAPDQVNAILGRSPLTPGFSQILRGLPRTYYVDSPGDIYGKIPKNDNHLVKIVQVIEFFIANNISYKIPKDANLSQFVYSGTAKSFVDGTNNTRLNILLRILFKRDFTRRRKAYLTREVLSEFLLGQFKENILPHWPYASKDRSVRLDQALALCFASNLNSHLPPGTQERLWWVPTLLSIQTLNRWIGRNAACPPLLFSLYGIKLSNGEYPCISIHRTRKFHHTAALLAGANSLFIDQLAGRQTGWQSEHYDLRTPLEIVRQSIDTFDPEEDFSIAGPLVHQLPPINKVIERKAFLMESVAPRHVTEIGGCRSDWSLNPCYQHGDCMRCDSHLWRKGDKERLSHITEIMEDARKAIAHGEAKLLQNPRMNSVQKHVRQLLETIQRCKQILEIEDDSSISLGTIVTFSSSPTAMTSSQLWSQLRAAHTGLS